MTILNLGKFIAKLDVMNEAYNTTTGAEANSDGWQMVRNATKPADASKRAVPQSRTISAGDGIFKTVELAQEIIYDNAGGQNFAAATLWQDGEVHRQITPELANVRHVLGKFWTDVLARTGKGGPDNYLLHVGDMDNITSMTRSSAQGFPYFGSQLAVITPDGLVYLLAMDRVEIHSVGSTKYAWRALVIPEDQEVSMVTKTTTGYVNDQATGYIGLPEGGQIAYFRLRLSEFDATRHQLTHYAHRQKVASAAMNLANNKVTAMASSDYRIRSAAPASVSAGQ